MRKMMPNLQTTLDLGRTSPLIQSKFSPTCPFLAKNTYLCNLLIIAILTMIPQLMELTEKEIMLGFAASCVEFVARKLGVSYKSVFESLERTNAIEGYIIPCYDTLHTQSREYVTDAVIEYLQVRGEQL